MLKAVFWRLAPLLLLTGCLRPVEPPVTAETVLQPNKAIVVHGFVCLAFSETMCTIEFGRLIGDGFSETDSQRIYAATRPENLLRYAGWGLPGASNVGKKMGYYAHVVEPGPYALKLFSTFGNSRTHNYFLASEETNRPFARVDIEAGKINYLGDFTFNSTPFKDQPRVIHGEDRPAAEAYLATFPKLTGEWVVKPVRIEP